mgnify:FL=1
MNISTDPVLSCRQAVAFEKEFFSEDRRDEWTVMNEVGEAIGDTLLRDMRELRTIAHRPRLLVLVGKGHNGGDALLAAKRLLRTIPTMRAIVWPLVEWAECRPFVMQALEEAKELVGKKMEILKPVSGHSTPDSIREEWEKLTKLKGFDATLDGLLGMQAKLPLRSPLKEWIHFLNQQDTLGARVAVDMPTGISENGEGFDESGILRADFTYCTGIAKAPVFAKDNAPFVGRIRYLDLGFFDGGSKKAAGGGDRVIRSSSLQALRRLRPAFSEKRSNGHLLLLAGSRDFAGAAMMAAQAALKAGVGLLSVGIPESLHAAFAAQRPEAMWVPLPETPEGNLALEGLGKVRSLLSKATALVAGPGLGQVGETLALVRETLSYFDGPVLLDADAIRTEVLEKAPKPEQLVLTPHAGEYQRIATGMAPAKFSEDNPSVLILKGAHTQIFREGSCFHSLGGSSVLARGGSGDILAGIVGALLAKGRYSALDASILGVQWHARAGEVLARQYGQEAVFTTELLNYLSFAIRNDH